MKKEYTNKKGKKAGVFEEGIYTKKVIREKHLMKMFNGYGIDKDIFEDLSQNNCSSVRIIELDTHKTLICPFELFDEKKMLKEFDGPQYFIQGKYLI